MSSDDEPLVSAARNVVARVCTTQIDDESSRMIPSTVPATPVTLVRVTGERAPCPSDTLMLSRMIWQHIVSNASKVGKETVHRSFRAIRRQRTWILFHRSRCVGST